MTWIRTVPPSEATGELKAVYDQHLAKGGFHSNFYEALSLKPEVATAIWNLVPLLSAGGTTLGRRKEELVAVVVSGINRNRYCFNGHGERLKAIAADVGGDVIRDWRTADLPADEVALLQFCEKATLRHEPMSADDAAALRSAGYTDKQVLEIVLLVALRQFCNTIGDALGVDPYFVRGAGQ